MDRIQYSELLRSSHRHNMFIAQNSSTIEVIEMAKKWNSRYFICAPKDDEVIGYVEWNDALKFETVKNKAPFKWYVREGTSKELQDVLRGIKGYYEEGEISKRGRKSKAEKVIDKDPMSRLKELEKENEILRKKIEEVRTEKSKIISILEKVMKNTEIMHWAAQKLVELNEN